MSEIYQHFHPDERIFIDRCEDWIAQVSNHYSIVTTYFLNPREVDILHSLISKFDVKLLSSSDLTTMEYAKIIIAPDYYQLDERDFELVLLEMRYPSKFVQLRHSQVLGAILGETGLKRQEIGGILVADGRIQIFVSTRAAQVIKNSIDKIGRTAVKFDEINFSQKISAEDKSETKFVLVSSIRADKIIAEAFDISRNIASNLMETGKVKINYREIDKKDFVLNPQDLLSVRGFGRIKIANLLGESKKGKLKLELDVIKNRKK